MDSLAQVQRHLSVWRKRATLRPYPAGLARREDRWVAVGASALAAVTLGEAITVNAGRADSAAIAWLTVALVAAVAGVAAPALRRVEALGERPVLVILGAGLAAQFAQFVTPPPGLYPHARRRARARPTSSGWRQPGCSSASACWRPPARAESASPSCCCSISCSASG